MEPLIRGKATAEAISIGVDPRLILSHQYFDNFNYRRHLDNLPNLEKRARQLSVEYREVQKARLINVVPVTDTGKAESSQNALKHGLNAPPEDALVSQWFNVILNNYENDLEAPNASDPRREAAFRLAIAESRYHRTLHKVDTYESEPGSAQQLAINLSQEIWNVLDGMPKEIADGPPDPHTLAYANFAIRQLEELLIQISRERRLYKRYLGEAWAQRKKALRAWCAFNCRENQNSRNELKLQS